MPNCRRSKKKVNSCTHTTSLVSIQIPAGHSKMHRIRKKERWRKKNGRWSDGRTRRHVSVESISENFHLRMFVIIIITIRVSLAKLLAHKVRAHQKWKMTYDDVNAKNLLMSLTVNNSCGRPNRRHTHNSLKIRCFCNSSDSCFAFFWGHTLTERHVLADTASTISSRISTIAKQYFTSNRNHEFQLIDDVGRIETSFLYSLLPEPRRTMTWCDSLFLEMETSKRYLLLSVCVRVCMLCAFASRVCVIHNIKKIPFFRNFHFSHRASFDVRASPFAPWVHFHSRLTMRSEWRNTNQERKKKKQQQQLL